MTLHATADSEQHCIVSVSRKFLIVQETDEAHEAWPLPHQLITTKHHVITYWGRWVRVQGEGGIRGEKVTGLVEKHVINYLMYMLKLIRAFFHNIRSK